MLKGIMEEYYIPQSHWNQILNFDRCLASQSFQHKLKKSCKAPGDEAR